MCGIFGYVANGHTTPEIVIEGLRRLEYRGYDSWGIAGLNPGETVELVRSVGKVSRTSDEELHALTRPASLCLGHTRWATHGEPSVRNAHPHRSQSGRILVVHNGIIENHRELRGLLESEGYVFQSSTDTEVIAQLLDRNLKRTPNFDEALSLTLLELRGAFGLAIMDTTQTDRLFAVRMGSPLVIGVDEDRCLISSDANALAAYTKQMIYLDDGEWAEVTREGVVTYDFHRAATGKIAEQIEIDVVASELGHFNHYMLKEIYDQPESMKTPCGADFFGGKLPPVWQVSRIWESAINQAASKFWPVARVGMPPSWAGITLKN